MTNIRFKDLKAEVHRNGKVFVQEYSKGIPKYDVKEVGETQLRGTTVHFKPDASIFITTEYNFETLSARMRELSFLNKGIRLFIEDRREKDDDGNYLSHEFYSENGLVGFVEYLDDTRENLLNEPIYIEGEKDGVPVEVAIQYNTSYSENVHSYVNNIDKSLNFF